MVRYTCKRMMLPTVEAALAAHGYILERPPTNQHNGERLILMSRASAVVLLSEHDQQDIADIEVYGASQATATALLEQLPVGLAKQPAPSGIAYQ